MIEQELKRIADALEELLEITKKEDVVEKKPVKEKDNNPPAPPKPKKEEPVIQLTLEELNTKLVEECGRLGGDMTPILNIIKKYGSDSLAEIDPSIYSKILEEVKQIKT